MRLVRATGSILESILDETYPLWGEGLTRKAYGHWNLAQERTDWGSGHLRRFALMDGARVLSSAKRYDLTLWLKGRRVATLGIAAVFTPESQRGHGYAAAVIGHLEEQARHDGAEVSLLFSEIGAEFYERLGYVQVPLTTVELDIHVKDGAPAMLVRNGEDRDAQHVAGMYVQRAASMQVALLADAAYVRFSISKKRVFTGLLPGGHRTVEYFVAEEGQQAVAFLVMHVTRGVAGQADTWSLEACGDRDPSGTRLGAMLQVLRARMPAAASPIIRAWWPTSLAPPQLRVRPRLPGAVVMMMKPIAPAVSLDGLTADRVMYWHGDAF